MTVGHPGLTWLLTAACILRAVLGQTCVLQPPAITDAQLTAICAGSTAFSSPACSIWRLCVDTTVKPSIFPQLCNTTRVSSSLCLDDAAVTSTIPQCSSLAVASTAVSPACVQHLGLFSIRSTSKTRLAAVNNCNEMAGMPMAGCDVCSNASCRDPLVSLAQGCADMEMPVCTQSSEPSISTFCGTDANIGGYGHAAAAICLSPAARSGITAPPRSPAVAASPPPTATQPPMPTSVPSPVSALTSPAPVSAVATVPTPTPTTINPPPPSATPQLAATDPCVTDPTTATCASYTYPTASIQADTASLCSSMPDMPGCTINKACARGAIVPGSQYCQPMTLLATLCADMPSMSGCKSYTSLCRVGTVVAQCAANPAIPSTPTWTSSRAAVFSICTDMFMTQCSACTKTSCPDPLATLVALCSDMPDMQQCSVVSSWCSATGGSGGGLSYFCAAGGEQGSGLPSMLMYFHERLQEVVLWRSWVPRTRGQYVGTVFAVLGFGVFSMALKAWSSVLSIGWRHPITPAQVSPASWWLPSRSQIMHNVVKGVIMAVSTCFDYFNMLVAMTFNVGLFVAVVLGYALGTLLVSHIPENYSTYLHAQRADRQAHQHVAILAGKMEDGVAPGGLTTQESGWSAKGVQDADAPACCPQPL